MLLGEKIVQKAYINDDEYFITRVGDLLHVRDEVHDYLTVYPDGGYTVNRICESDLITAFGKLLVCLLNDGNEEKLLEYEVFGGVVLSCYSVDLSIRAKLSDGDSYVVIDENRSIIANKGMSDKHIMFLLSEMAKMDSAIRAYGSIHKQVSSLYNKAY